MEILMLDNQLQIFVPDYIKIHKNMEGKLYNIKSKTAKKFINLYGLTIFKLVKENLNNGELGNEMRKLYFSTAKSVNE